MWERQKCQGADKRKIGWERYKRKESVRMMVASCVRKSLMEMDQTKVEIRWGNCEKMADVLTRDVDLCSQQEDGCKRCLGGGFGDV